jgi:hypothetical protein
MGYFFIKGHIRFRGLWGGYMERKSQGIDEYEAIENLLTRYYRERQMNSTEKNIADLEAIVTVKSIQEIMDRKPKFDNESNYNKGLSTRFWIRFAIADSIERLEEYGTEFGTYVSSREDNNDPFQSESINALRKHYLACRDTLKKQEEEVIHPIFYVQDKDNLSDLALISRYTSEALSYLKSRGYRIEKLPNNGFRVTSGTWAGTVPRRETWNAADVDLILLAERLIEDWNDNPIPSVLEYLGQSFSDNLKQVKEELKRKKIHLMISTDDIGVKVLYVLKRNEKATRDLLRGLKVDLVQDYTDPFTYNEGDGLGSNYWHNLNNMFDK